MVKQQFDAEYDYCAFISFSSEDVKIADWLKHRLDRYNIPTFIRREHKFHNKRLKPSYSYLHSSEAGRELLVELKKRLERSRYLIIVCSPNSAVSTYCNWEIETFIALGRKDYIIPIVVDGTPYSDNVSTECLCPKLKEVFPLSSDVSQDRQIKCANLKEKGISFIERKQHAFIQIVARILEVKSDKLWSQVHYRNIIKYSFIAVFMMFVVCVGLGSYKFYKTSYEYYRYCDDCDGVPRGIMPISPEEAKKLDHHFKFETSQNRVDRVVYCNSYGRPIDPINEFESGGTSICEISYESNNHIRIVKRDKDNNYLYEELVSPSRDVITLIQGENDRVAKLNSYSSSVTTSGNIVGSSLDGMISTQSILKRAQSQVSRYHVDRDDEHFVVRKMYQTYEQDQICDANGIYGIAYERDSLYRLVAIHYLNQDGESYAANGYGISTVRVGYDSRGNCAEIKFLDADDDLVQGDEGYARMEHELSENYDKLESRVYDDTDSPCIDCRGVHKIVSYIEDGLVVKSEAYDLSGNLVNMYNNAALNFVGGFSIMEIEYEDGLSTRYTLYDKNGDRCCDNKGVSRRDFEYEDGRLVSMSCFNINDERCLNSDGISKEVYEYNSDGYRTSFTFYNTKDVLVNNNMGFAKMIQKYNKDGLLESQHYVNANGSEQDLLSLNMGANVYLKYNKNNIVEYKNVATNGFVVSWLSYEWNSFGQIDRCVFRNAEGVAAVNPNTGYAIARYKYDYRGRVKTMRFFDENDIPCYDINGNAGIRYQYYDDKTIGYDFLDRDGYSLVSDSLTIPQVRYDYDGRLLTSVKYYNQDDSPINNYKTGVHRISIKYNDSCLPVEVRYYDVDSKHIIHRAYGCHKVVFEYDDQNRVIKTSKYDEYNNLSAKMMDTLYMSNNGFIYENGMDNTMDPSRVNIALNQNGMLGNDVVAKCEVSYGKANTPDIMRFYNSNDELVIQPQMGAAIVKSEWDVYNRPVSTLFLDENGDPIDNVNGYHEWRVVYNNNSIPHITVYYDKNHDYTCPNNGDCAIGYNGYNDKGEQIFYQRYDDQGELIIALFRIMDSSENNQYLIFVSRVSDVYKIERVLDYSVEEEYENLTAEQTKQFSDMLKTHFNFDLNEEHVFSKELLE